VYEREREKYREREKREREKTVRQSVREGKRSIMVRTRKRKKR